MNSALETENVTALMYKNELKMRKWLKIDRKSIFEFLRPTFNENRF